MWNHCELCGKPVKKGEESYLPYDPIKQEAPLVHKSCEPPPRSKLIAHIKEQIDAGTYITEGKLRAAVDNMVDSGDFEVCPLDPIDG